MEDHGKVRENGVTTLKYPGLDHQPSDGEKRGRFFQGVRRLLRSQFSRPTGLLGSLVGIIMAHRPSNVDRIRWTLSLLDLRPDDRVLEVGFGPGVAIELVSKIVTGGLVAGIDHSGEMVRHASRRNAEGVRSGRVVLRCASASAPTDLGAPFDKIFTINAIHFWDEPMECLARLRKLLRPGGLMAVTLQPRMRSATDETTEVLGKEIAGNLKAAGFSSCDVKIRKAQPVSVVCVLATN